MTSNTAATVNEPVARPAFVRRANSVLKDPLLSVVMPVYNERTTIDEIIRRVLAVRLRIELIVVDDCSTDGTGAMLDALQSELGFTLLRQPRTPGKGAALRRGFAAVTGDLVIIQDADLEYSPEEYPQLIELICQGRADVVFGSRFLGRHRVFLFTHYLGNRLLTLATNILYNTMLTDMETCYKVMRVGRAAIDDAATRTASASSRRSPPRSSSAATASTKSRSPTPAAATMKARRSPGATASSRSGCC